MYFMKIYSQINIFNINLFLKLVSFLKLNKNKPKTMKSVYPVERILNKRIKNGKLEYLLKWKGYERFIQINK